MIEIEIKRELGIVKATPNGTPRLTPENGAADSKARFQTQVILNVYLIGVRISVPKDSTRG